MPRPSRPDHQSAPRSTPDQASQRAAPPATFPASLTARLRLAGPLVQWQRKAGRHDLPWQVPDAYRVWLSEIMLQQTQVVTVIPYFEAFLKRFPDIAALAAASQEEVLESWSGLGYYSRARNLHRCAKVVVTQHEGRFPEDVDALEALPGIGRSTAAAIAVFSFGHKAAILDGNVKRVLSRVFGIAGQGAATERELWDIAQRQLPDTDIEAYTQGLMDLGASLCNTRRHQCAQCPLQALCLASHLGMQASLPSPKKRKAIAQRQAHLAFVLRGNEVLLELRPSPGIWGGLLSLPEFELARSALPMLGLGAGEASPAGGFEHSFTHFKLSAEISHLSINTAPASVHAAEHAARPATNAVDGQPVQPDLRWVAVSKLPGAALPKPIKTWLLDKLPAR